MGHHLKSDNLFFFFFLLLFYCWDVTTVVMAWRERERVTTFGLF